MLVMFFLQIRQNDRLAVSKLVTSLTRGTVRSPLAQCLLIRYTSQVSLFTMSCGQLSRVSWLQQSLHVKCLLFLLSFPVWVCMYYGGFIFLSLLISCSVMSDQDTWQLVQSGYSLLWCCRCHVFELGGKNIRCCLAGAQVIEESTPNAQTGDRPFYDYLEGCLRHKTEMVVFEAARAVTELSGVTSRELTPAITVLQLFLSSSKPVLRFAAVRTLNKVSLFLHRPSSGKAVWFLWEYSHWPSPWWRSV